MTRHLLDKTEAARLIEAGLPAPEIAKRLGVTRQCIHQFAKAAGIYLLERPRGGRPKTTSGRMVCLKLQVPLAVKRWATEHRDRVIALLMRGSQSASEPGDIWEDVYGPDPAPRRAKANFEPGF